MYGYAGHIWSEQGPRILPWLYTYDAWLDAKAYVLHRQNRRSCSTIKTYTFPLSLRESIPQVFDRLHIGLPPNVHADIQFPHTITSIVCTQFIVSPHSARFNTCVGPKYEC